MCARRGQYTTLPSWTAPCPRRRYRPTHIAAVGTNLNSPAHMDALQEPIGAVGDASTLPLACERTACRVQGRVAVRPGLPNGRERTKSVRSEPSGSEGMRPGYARSRVAVHPTLPLAGERTARRVQGRVAVRWARSGPSGSAMGTLGAEWQCYSHCHSPVNVLCSASHTATRQ